MSDGDTVDAGPLVANVIHTPGHTEGSVCLFFPGQQKLIAGDTLFAGSIGRTDLPGGSYDKIIRSLHAGDVFTISLHQENNYPMYKPPSSIDVDLPDGITDDDYLAWLDNALSSGLRQFEPDLICYVAGADPYKEDQLGGLQLSLEGLKRRDELVFRVAKTRQIPVMVTYAGGYAQKVDDTVAIHSNTVVAAAEVFQGATK